MGFGGTMVPPDDRDAGVSAAERLTGLNARSPLVSTRSGSGLRNDVDHKFSRISTSRQADDGIPHDMPGAASTDTWKSAFNPHSPAFWVLLFILGILGFAQLHVRVGGKRGIGAGFG